MALCKRGVQFAACFSKSSLTSSSVSKLAESTNVKRVVNNRGRWAFGAVRGYNSGSGGGGGGDDDALSNSFLSNQIQKKPEHTISALPLEIEKLRNEIQKRNKEQFQFETELRNEIEKRNQEALERLQFENEKLRNEIEKMNKESSERLQFETKKLRSDIDVTSARIDVIGDVLKEKTLKTTESIKAIDQSIKAIDQSIKANDQSIKAIDQETDGDIRLLDKKIDELRADLKWQSNFTTLWFLSTYLWIWVFYK